MPEMVRITDVSPRDGLQNEPGFVMTSEKARLVELPVEELAASAGAAEKDSFGGAAWMLSYRRRSISSR
ncbi:MAG: hypothetical protein IIB53_15185 [Planctomycetes bacterium]|nr:hypothetical protein [Planctomycetota bacterium]